ncbi:hypothetical protein CLOM_g3970 [Closterium sp. NIES-68]|nr:hypothetical protein CLOM_g3970 [Closterium sp. NIES-68]GJP78105.1 hypothetical protein CLOP_g8431 [Closterium sp. NIES-67]GJP83195.1 hypothetical protein CLOP_g13383 [Closterium sp. NIES-67]
MIEKLQDISKNEAERELLQQRLDSFVSNNEKSSFLHILHQFRFLSVAMTEVQFQLALRDQLIEEKSSALNSLWMLLQASDVDIEELLDVAVQKGVPLDSSLSSYIDMKLKEAITTPNGSPRFAQSVIRAATRTVHSRLNRANTDPAGSLSRPDMSFGSDDTGEVADCPDEREEELHLHAGNVPANQEATDRGTPDQVEDVVSQLPELNAGGSVAAIICEAMSAGMLSTPKAVGCLNSDADLIAEAEAFAYPSGNTVLQGSPDSPSSKARAKDDAHASTYSPKTSSPRKRWQGQSSMSSSPNSPARRAGLPATGPRRPVPKERKISTYHKKCFCSHHEKDEVKT